MRRPLTAIILFICMVVLFNSCMLGPNYQRAVPTLSETYRFDSTVSPTTNINLELRWWEMFDDPILDTLIITGLRQNKNLLIIAQNIEQARAELRITKADYWPQFDYNVGLTTGNFLNGQTFDQTAEVWTGVGSMSWEIGFWGKFRRANEAARAELVASEFGLRSIQLDLISEIASTYFLLLDFHWRLAISEATVASRDESVRIIQARFDEGTVAEIDLNQAQIQRAIAATAVPVYVRSIAQIENVLSILIGENPRPIQIGDSLSGFDPPPGIPAGIPSTLIERRPDVLQTENLLHAQTARIGVAEALRYPSFNLTALLGVASPELSTITSNGLAWQVSGSLLGPIFYFGKNKRRVEIEKSRTEQVLRDYEQSVLIALQEVEDALVGIETKRQELLAVEDYVDAARSARFLSRRRYDEGVTSYLEVLETDRSAFDAELAYSQTSQELLNSYVELYRALGGGWISPEELQAQN